jgi:hypothetical protein
MNTFRNVHLKATTPAPARPADQIAPKLRFVTNDPAREYSQRPGEVEPLPDAVAALILSKQGFSKVSRNGIRIEGLAPKPLTFWCENSQTIIEKAGTNEKVLWTINRQRPEVLHILTLDGEYVESIPLDGKVPWFDAAATAQQLGAKRRANQRRMDRVADLHAPDSEAALERETHNGAQIAGVVQTFPTQRSGDGRQSHGRIPQRQHDEFTAPGADRGTSSNVGGALAPRSDRRPKAAPTFPRASRIHQIQADLNTQRVAHSERQDQLARRVGEVTDEEIDFLTDTNSGPARNEAAVLSATTGSTEAEDASDWVL